MPHLHQIHLKPRTLTAEAVKSTALPLQSIHHIHGGDGFPASVLSVGNSVTDDILQEDLEDATCLLIDEPADTLHTAPTSQTANCRLRDTLDVVPQHLTVSFGSTLSQTLASFATAGHFFYCI